VSYTRRYSEVVSDSETVSISYPASESGGTVSETVTIRIPVNIEIHVDTNPFDGEVASCEDHLNVLTGAVVATEAAQVAVISQSAAAVSTRITEGFFGLIRSELTQQMTEYRHTAEALVLKLNDMKVACLSRITQMERDYARIAERYTNLFDDLDNEIANRITALDGAAFNVHREVSEQSRRVFAGTLSTTATVTGGENTRLQSAIVVGGVRQRANQLLGDAHRYLSSEKRLSRTIRNILTKNAEGDERWRYLPILYRASHASKTGDSEELFIPGGKESPFAAAPLKNRLRDSFRDDTLTWRDLTATDRSQIDTYLNKKVSQLSEGGNAHQLRVCETVIQLWIANQPQVL
jgi:hypothetical protein